MKNIYNIRAISSKAVKDVICKKKFLSIVLPPLQKKLKEKDRSLLQELCFGTIRFLPKLEWMLCQLMEKPLKIKNNLVHYLLIVGIYQIINTRIPPYAILSETVNATEYLKKQQFKGLINGVLRKCQRQKQILQINFNKIENKHLHPLWMNKQIKVSFPKEYDNIINSNNQKAPIWLRVNRRYHSKFDYLQLLKKKGFIVESHAYLPDAIKLITSIPVNKLPGFHQGWVSLQDISSQRCSIILDPKDGELILDLCAAPGGKTTHILEISPNSKVIAVDINRKRTSLIYENLKRLKLQAKVIVGDARTPENWWNKEKLFDRILLDAPCSSTGVIRRHPEIKWLLQDKDIIILSKLQKQILKASWRLLKPGGVLLYSTCSILPKENSEQISTFLIEQPEAELKEICKNNYLGIQCFPNSTSGDGFFYAKMIKNKL